MDVKELHRRSVELWLEVVAGVGYTQWEQPTPCTDWDVRALVNHVAYEDRWTVPLVEGQTVEQVGDAYEGDLLGEDPTEGASAAGSEAVGAVNEATVDTVHLSYGAERLEEYVRQLSADHVVHGWDLAVATGQSFAPDADLVAEVAGWFAGREDGYRGAGVIAQRPVSTDDSALARLLVGFGRDPGWTTDHGTLTEFSAAFGAGDVDRIMALMTDDVVFEATGPAPDGRRFEGAEAVRAVWEDLFGNTAGARFTQEESFVAGGRAVLRWRFDWDGEPAGHVRGVDVMRLRDGKVAEKLSYVKG